MTLTLGIGRSFVRTAGSGVAHGPTVQIASVPATLTLAHGATGSALAGTPQDISAVSTGQRKYWHSSDLTKVTVDPDTGVPTGVAAGSATITVNFIAPAGEPAYTGAVGQTVILNTDLTEAQYASATVAGQYPYAGGDAVGPTRMAPLYSPACPAGGGIPVDTTRTQIVTDSGATWLRATYFGEGNGSSNWQLVPPQPQTVVRTYGLSTVQRWNLTTGLPQVKNIEAWGQGINPDDNGRLQVDTVPAGPGGTQMQFGARDQAFTTDPNDLVNPFGYQVTSIADGGEHPVTMKWRWHARSPGTVDRLIQSITPVSRPTFETSQSGVLANGNRVLIYYRDIGGSLVQGSTAEFLVSGFDGDRTATLTRQPDITGSTVAYSGGVDFLAEAIYQGVFSVSQAGHLANGDIVSMNNGQGMVPCVVGAFDGTTGCTLAQYNPSEVNLPRQDFGGLWFSRPSDQTGFVEYWIDHVKIIHICAANIGVTPAGGIRPWCTAASLATLGVGASLTYIRFGNVQANSSGAWSLDNGRRITLWWEP